MTKCWEATPDDLDTLVILAREFHSISPFSEYPFSPAGSRSRMGVLMQAPGSVIFMHSDGLIGGSVSDYPYCNLRLAKEEFWYTRPDTDGLSLLKRWQGWVEREGAELESLSTLSLDNGRRAGLMSRVMRRAGYKEVEQAHMRTI